MTEYMFKLVMMVFLVCTLFSFKVLDFGCIGHIYVIFLAEDSNYKDALVEAFIFHQHHIK